MLQMDQFTDNAYVRNHRVICNRNNGELDDRKWLDRTGCNCEVRMCGTVDIRNCRRVCFMPQMENSTVIERNGSGGDANDCVCCLRYISV